LNCKHLEGDCAQAHLWSLGDYGERGLAAEVREDPREAVGPEGAKLLAHPDSQADRKIIGQSTG